MNRNRSNWRRYSMLSSILLIVALLLAACPVPEEPVAPIEVPELEVTPEPTVRSQTLNIAIPGRIADPTNLNIYAPGVSRSNTGIHQVIYEYFFYYNLQTGEYIPWLAEGYEYNDDFTSITVFIRDGVTWNDGEPFTADDVVFTYELLLDNPGMVWAAEVANWVDSIHKLDDLTVHFDLLEANPRFHLNREAFPAVGIWGGITILPQHVWEGEDPLRFTASPPVSTGPYRLQSASETAITYERRDDWWGAEVFGVTPAPRYVNFQHYGPETSVALALAANDIDTPNIGILSQGSFLEVATRNPAVRAWHEDAPYAWLDPCPRGLMVQNAHSPFDQAEVRWALTHMIDRDVVVNLAYEGTTVPSWGIWPFYDGLQPYFDAVSDLIEAHPVTTYDPDRAAELLEGAGFSRGADGVWVSGDGERLEATYLVNADSGEEMRVSAVVADQLEAQGVEVTRQPLSGGVLSDAILRGEYDLKLHSMCPGFIYDNLELFHSKFYVELGEPAPWFERNSFRYQNPEFDAIVDEMAFTPPDEVDVIQDQFRQAMEILFEDLPVIPMVQAPALVPFNHHYWDGWPTAESAWNMPVSWWATFNLVINGYESPETGEWVGGIHSTGEQ